MSIAFIFPGQGSQAVGMGAELAKAYAPARAVFAEIDEALGQPLSRLMWEGPEDQLTLTENAQPALMAVSLAALRMLGRGEGIALKERVTSSPVIHSASIRRSPRLEVLSLADTARLLKTRGRAMQAAVPVGQGAMAALLGAELPRRRNLPRPRATARSAPLPTTTRLDRW